MTRIFEQVLKMKGDMGFRRSRSGFTVIELFIVIMIISVLISLLLPAIQSARENARRTQCIKNLMQIGIAMANYASTHKVFPPGVVNDQGPISNMPVGYHFGWAVQILPYLEAASIHRQFDFKRSVYAEENMTARGHSLQVYACPSDDAGGPMSYAACHHDVEAPIAADNHGVFYLNSRITYDDLSDGPAQTIFVGEIRHTPSAGWAVGTTATLRNTGTPVGWDDPLRLLPAAGSTAGMGNQGLDPVTLKSLVTDGQLPAAFVGGFQSLHSAGANFLFGDGSVRLLTAKIKPEIYRSLGNRADGNLVSDDEY